MKSVLLLLMCLSTLACTHGNCRSHKLESEAAQKAAADATAAASGQALPSASPQESTMVKPSIADRVSVAKPDGSLQCGQGQAIPLAEMQKQLGKIQVFSSSNKNDGMMRIQVCGAPTGAHNVYEIARKDLLEATKKGFKEWTVD